MPKRFWEDFEAGSVAEYGPRLVTRDEIVAFAQAYDPQPVHLDEAAAQASMLGGLCASGWHICALAMRMMADGFLRESSGRGSPGVDEVRWLRPLRPGDRIILRATVLETRLSRSRPDMGLTAFRFEILREDGAEIMLMTSTMMLGRRPADAAGVSTR